MLIVLFIYLSVIAHNIPGDSLFTTSITAMMEKKELHFKKQILKNIDKEQQVIANKSRLIPVPTLAFKNSTFTRQKRCIYDKVSLNNLDLKKVSINTYICITSKIPQLLCISKTSKGKLTFAIEPHFDLVKAVAKHDSFFIIAGFNGLFMISDTGVVSFSEFKQNGDCITENIGDYIIESIRSGKVVPCASSEMIRNRKRLIAK